MQRISMTVLQPSLKQQDRFGIELCSEYELRSLKERILFKSWLCAYAQCAKVDLNSSLQKALQTR